MTCNNCLTPVEGYEIESDDPNVGWCSRHCWETDNQDAYMEDRRVWDDMRAEKAK